jgi:site-specific DNA-methyltransferase (adenine-specific)
LKDFAVDFSLRQGILTLPWPCDVALREDALTLLRAMPDDCAAVAFFDPQYRGVLDRLKFGNEGARQKGRYKLPSMSSQYIDACGREIARILRPSGYLALWADTFNVCQAHHLRIADAIQVVDLIAWDNLRPGMGKRSRQRGDYVVLMQTPPISPSTWRDRSIPNRWPEKIDLKAYPRKIYPHTKPFNLISRLIGAITKPGDLVVDPAAGSFVVMHVATKMQRRFIGCDIAHVAPIQRDGSEQ